MAGTLRRGSIRILGLRELQFALRAMDKAKPRLLQQANKSAAEMVASRARGAAAAYGSVQAKSGPSIRAVAQQRSAGVRLGGARAPYALGAEFGATRYRQFPPWTTRGYFLYPTVRSSMPDIEARYEQAINTLVRSLGG